jgi:hypothetical protein
VESGGVRQWWVSADDDGNAPLLMLGFVGGGGQ